jgi:hypothetical protein
LDSHGTDNITNLVILASASIRIADGQNERKKNNQRKLLVFFSAFFKKNIYILLK